MIYTMCVPTALAPVLFGVPATGIFAIYGAISLFFVLFFATQGFSQRKIRFGGLTIAFFFATTLCILGGQGGLLYSNPDWLWRNAVLRDLAAGPWPVVYSWQSESLLLRAPLGMYIIPALAAHVIGASGAQFLLATQNIIIFTLIFYFVAGNILGVRNMFVVVLVFCLFSGWDIVGMKLGFSARDTTIPEDHIEAWARYFQYSSMVTQIFWVPNHAAPAWAFACVYMMWCRSEVRIGLLLALVPLFAFWSPLSAIGTLPFAFYAGLKSLKVQRFTFGDAIITAIAGAISLPALYYQQLGATQIDHGFTYNLPYFWLFYAVFLILELLPLLVLIAYLDRRAANDPTLMIAIFILVLIPLYRLGGANDFAMRSSIPALAIMAIIAGSASVRFCEQGVFRVRMILPLVVLSIGSITGLIEIRRSLVREPVAEAKCNLIQVWQMERPKGSIADYAVSLAVVPTWMLPSPVATQSTATSSSCGRHQGNGSDSR
ncbi:hypothetical protein [Falsiroseomonas sp. HW251]|uniref:hypothetical protein n=1 Tax=Falsiroseomonas sp. HW251 TaxID=3390998 RepID=UPI003D31333A